ncbi:MAG: N-acetylmuramoyl-L-alanine amidase [candidate division KSB1 bacterium]|nr:N-acetylmuramoyl-L-alanine amidase [candidate division KSB1 bacterium]
MKARLGALLTIFAWTALALAHVPEGARKQMLRITFPARTDTVGGPRVRIAGSTLPHARVLINDRVVRVYPSGAFVDRVALAPGLNRIVVQAQDSAVSVTDTLQIYRIPPLAVSPTSPTQIDTNLVEPTVDMVLGNGDLVRVRFKGSPGGSARFTIDNLCKDAPMVELPPQEADGMVGIYQGMLRIKAERSLRPARVHYELRGADGKKAKAESKGTISVWDNTTPLVAEAVSETPMWNAPQGGAIIWSLLPGVRVEITGKIGSRYRARLSPQDVVWLNSADMRMLPLGTSVPRAVVGSMTQSVLDDRVQLTLDMTGKVPFRVEQSLNPAWIDLYLYGAHQGSQWLTYPERPVVIERVTWSQPAEGVYRLRVELDQKQQWGYRVMYGDQGLVLEVRRAPRIAKPPQSPVAGLIFVLDPGHGGEEPGAISPTGMMEKDVNLKWAKALAGMLRSAGAQVVLTREDDRTLSLKERVQIAQEARAHIFVMMHNNSVGEGADPLVRGTSTYYTQPHSQDLAWTVYPRLRQLGLPGFGKVFSSYFITRQTDMLYFLVEGAFMSNPEDEMLLMNDSFITQMAKAVFDGLEDFLRKQAQ